MASALVMLAWRSLCAISSVKGALLAGLGRYGSERWARPAPCPQSTDRSRQRREPIRSIAAATRYRRLSALRPSSAHSGWVLPSCRSSITIPVMETVTLKLDRLHVQKLRARSKATGRSQAAVVRDLIDRHLGGTTPSLHEQAQDLCGSVSGEKDTSTRALEGYGHD